MKIIREEAVKHHLHIDNRTPAEKSREGSPVLVRLLRFEENSVKLRAYVWAKSVNDAFVLGCDLNEKIKQRFDESGIDLSPPSQTVIYHGMKEYLS